MSLETVRRFLEGDRFSEGCGIRLVEVRPGFAKTEMAVTPGHMNGAGVLQGGALFTLADLAFAGACNSHGELAVGCQVDVTWFKGVTSGVLTATAEEISRTRRLSTCVVHVRNERNELVALFKGVAYIKGSPLPVGL